MPDARQHSADPAANTPVSRREVVETVAGLWWLLLLRGVLLIIVGAYALITPGLTLIAYTWVLGVFVLADGVLALLASVMGWSESRGWALARGVIGVLVGLFVIAHPALVGEVGLVVLVVVLGVQSLIAGVLEIYVAIRERKEIEGEWWLILGGLLSLVFGVILLVSPLMAGRALVMVLGIFAMIFGAALIASALRLKSFHGKLAEHAA